MCLNLIINDLASPFFFNLCHYVCNILGLYGSFFCLLSGISITHWFFYIVNILAALCRAVIYYIGLSVLQRQPYVTISRTDIDSKKTFNKNTKTNFFKLILCLNCYTLCYTSCCVAGFAKYKQSKTANWCCLAKVSLFIKFYSFMKTNRVCLLIYYC